MCIRDSAQAAQHLAFIAHTDLAQLNAGVELPGQVLDQLAEVHTVVGGKIEHQLADVYKRQAQSTSGAAS